MNANGHGTSPDGGAKLDTTVVATLPLPLPVEEIRFGGEALYAAALRQTLQLAPGALRPGPDTARIRRELMARSLLLSEGMAPAVYAAAREGAARFGIAAPVEVFQSAGAENAAMHLVESPVLLEIQGRLLSLLDAGALRAVVGHELGHFLAHGPKSPHADAARLIAPVLHGAGAPAAAEGPAQRLSMAMELTADRFGLLACGDLVAALRLEMVAVTGLAADSLTWDTQAYLDQSRALMEATLAEGDTALGYTHPEHSLRTYALWLFSESDLYRRLTGSGSGSRLIAEVDQQLLRILGRPEVDLGTADLVEEPPAEVHECALAACVLIAAADGNLHDAELAAIERVFAPLVADWRALLDPPEALARFQRFGPLVAAAGPRMQRSLFTLLVHVLAVDDEVHESELQMLLAIGGALGCRQLYGALLPPVLAQFGIPPEAISAQEPRAIPMPPRTGEAEAALGVYLEGVARRGGDRVTLRRLLRLLGERRPTPELIATLAKAAEHARLLVDPAFGEDLDEPHRLTLTPEAQAARRAAAPPVPTGTGSPVQRLTKGLTRLRDKLVSGDGRSPAIRLPGPRTGRALDLCLLEEVSQGLAERTLVLLRAGKRARLVEGAEAGGHEGARRLAGEVVALDREHRARLEESGANDLFLGYPFLTGLAGGYLFRGPLLLYPAAIERGGSQGAGIALVPAKDEPPIANQSLLRLLFARKGRPYGDALAERLDALAAEGPEAVIAALREEGVATVARSSELTPLRNRSAELGEWRDDRLEIEECAVLGLFPQSSSDLLQDYDALLAELSSGAPPAALLGCARELLPPDLREAVPAAGMPTAASGAGEPVPMVYADPSQRAVLTQARANRALVVDGPPGTGKSQVIVNLVADALARGERVAVVCEKRAALDVVVNRLEAQGLRHLLAVVHDVQEDRRGLYRQVVARLEDDAERKAPGAELGQAARTATDLSTQIQRRTMALAQRHQGLALGELHTYAAGLDTPADGQRAGAHWVDLATLDSPVMEQLATDIAPLHTYADLWCAASPWVHPGASRPNLANLDAAMLERIGKGLAVTAELARQVEDLCRRLGVAPDPQGLASIARARVALQAVADTRAGRSDRRAQEVFVAFLARGVADEASMAALAAAEAAWAEGAEAAREEGQAVRFPETPETRVALDQVARLHGSLFRFFQPVWWRAGKTLRATLQAHWPERAAAPLDGALVAAVRARLAAGRLWRNLEAVLPLAGPGSRSLPATAAEAGVWLGGLGATWRQVRPLLALRPTLEAAGAWPEALVVPALEAWDRQVAERIKLLQLRDRLGEAREQMARVIPWIGEWPRADWLSGMAAAWQRDGLRLIESDRMLARARGHFPKAAHLVRHLAEHHRRGDWAEVVRKGWALAGIAQIEAGVETRYLDQLTAEEAQSTGRRLDAVLAHHAHLNVAQLLARQDQHPLLTVPQPGKGQRRNTAQAVREALLKEAKKQRNILPLRGFVRRFGEEGLLDLLPVWLLSPQTMAVLFPRKALFDQVIIDEASQCTVENGLAVLLRGKRAVIAGDERQMPPTNFFRAGEAAADEDDEDSERRDLREMFDAESLLVLARGRVPHAGLGWHYRCLHEELIAFSNHALYGGTLKTIPSTASRTAPPALRWVHVPDGCYEDGANPGEAARLVDLLGELLQRADRPTLGVVTFNLVQRRAILDEIDRRQTEDGDFAAAYDAAMAREHIDERPFVKNLESVQGDERDLILFSLGHAPLERTRRDGRVERYVPARFGPLGQKGGERRLNVAVSRAKREILVVASFDPVLLSVARSKNDGPKLFKQFLEYAHHLAQGRRNQAERVLAMARGAQGEPRHAERGRHPSGYIPLKVQLALALEQRGHRCELDVGTSEQRIPLAVLDAADDGRYRLGILCEEGEQAPHPLESHVHVPRVLEARAWCFLTVDGREWERDRERVLRRIGDALATD